MKNQKGITLIALIITIIVMLILVGVSVSISLNGGLFNTAKESVDKTKTASEEEAGLKYEYEIAKATEEYTGTYKEYLLQKEYEEVKSTGSFTGTYKEYLLQKEYEEAKNAGSFTGTYTEYVASKYGLGTAINTDNYGKKVVGYKSKGEGLDTLVWRVFYQDDKNTYLISEKSNKNLPVRYLFFYTYNSSTRTYTKKDIVEKYKNGADVSVYGQALMPKASSLFTEDNDKENIIATAYLCDPEVWDAYTDAEGKASYAIGSPTIELFVASYNESTPRNSVELDTNAYGYTDNPSADCATTRLKNGIYNLNTDQSFWLASPDGTGSDNMVRVYALSSMVWCNSVSASEGVRPVVSIPTSDFQNSYTLEDGQ